MVMEKLVLKNQIIAKGGAECRLSQESPKLHGGYSDVIRRMLVYSQPWVSPYGPFHTAQYAEYRHCALRVDIVGCADEGGASFAIDGLRKLSPSYGATALASFRGGPAVFRSLYADQSKTK